MNLSDIQKRLFELRDDQYCAFQIKLVPGIAPESMIGVRIPLIRTIARELRSFPETQQEFLNTLPHRYYDENILHAALISAEKQPEKCVLLIDAFLPFVDNWAVCDTIRPKCFKSCPKCLEESIDKWLSSGKTYSVRFAMGALMSYYLDSGFRPEHPEMIVNTLECSPCAGEYYVRMMAAWYFATALAKQYDAALPYIEQRRLEPWTHNKTIQKSIESFRITPEQKDYLRSLKV